MINSSVATMDIETWVKHPRDDRYEISSFGRVRRSDTKRLRKPSVGKNGYCVSVFSRPGAKHHGHYVHRSVMEAFTGACPDGMEVSHLDGNRLNNSLSNLTYETRTANMHRKKEHGTEIIGIKNPARKLDESLVLKIREMKDAGLFQKDIAAIIGVSPMTVSRVVRGLLWSHVK